MRNLSIDVETFSSIDLSKSGCYRYVESPNFEILLFGYSVDGAPVQIVDLAQGETIPEAIINSLTDETVTKWAFNSNFERVCLSRYLGFPTGKYLNPSSWRCSMVWSAYMGLPLSLEGVGAVLKLGEQKLKEGKDLIRYFCVPCKPTKANGGRTRNLPEHDLAKWSLFKKYNIRDVEVEQAVKKRLENYLVPEFVWDEYHLDQVINDRGILLDMGVVKNAIIFDERSKQELTASMKDLTNLDNPNSVIQVKQWLSDNGVGTESLDKKNVAALIKTAPDDQRDVLLLRQQLAKSSVKKYQAMSNSVCSDGRARGMFFFYGASRSGRWAGRHIQLQNLPQNHIPDLEDARSLVKLGDYDAVKLLYEDVPDTLSQLIRTAFIPKPGYKFIVSDFSAIEARVLSFLAREQWRLDVFESDGDIYCASASAMFRVPVEKHGVNSHLRQKGKQAELACIAEGQLVLTDQGLIPIEEVKLHHKLWDGGNWVSHEGVISKGERKVISYEGLTATPDHLVWVEGQQKPIHFGIAASIGSHLVQTGHGRKAIRLGEDHIIREKMECENKPLLCIDQMHRLRQCSVAKSKQFNQWKDKWLPKLLSAAANTQMTLQKTRSSTATLHKPERPRLSQLWRKGNSFQFPKYNCCEYLPYQEIWLTRPRNGARQDQQRKRLCSWESLFFNAHGKQLEQTLHSAFSMVTRILAVCKECRDSKAVSRPFSRRCNRRCRIGCYQETQKLENHQRTARLYDIRDAGPNHRFTVSGKLVHNCGYGGSVGALKAMGALEMGLTEEELQPLVDSWRTSNPKITKLWWDVDRVAKEAIRFRTHTNTHGISFYYQKGMLFIELPSGRRLSYVKPKIGENQFGGESVTYEGTGNTKKWERIESYGPKFVENIVQAISRDILAYAMKTLSHCFICGHVHDELIIECRMDVSLEVICEQMGKTPPWMKGLALRADGYETMFYKKD